ncbi:hypothetical protein FGO68_gene7867 [Halteria grandinella]|uniref:Protein kinase domain-containing protein n=1 Tax=Halteria grandinella TaxID=5974 RepID=A0A8J8T5F4_HALGN|nr:hypothetical protein FGO68_gene7867 [Halteria grandinella]
MAFSHKDICLIFFQGEEVIKRFKVQFAQFKIVEQGENIDDKSIRSSCLLGKPQQSILLKTQSTSIIITPSQTEDECQSIMEWKYILNPFVIQGNIDEAYQILDRIGKGTQGQVFKGVNKKGDDTNISAIKVISLQKICYDITLLTSIKNELSLQQKLHQCEGVLKVREMFMDLKSAYIVLDYQSEGTILSKILGETRFEEKQIRLIMTQLLLTVNFIHQMGIVHRDIKLENVLIDQVSENIYDVKIADFGLACLLPQNGQKLYEKCGSPSYIAPEILKGEGYRQECDMFSLGSIFFNLLTGAYLVNGSTQSELLLKNQNFDLNQISEVDTNSPHSKDLLMKLLNPEPSQRITSHDALLHSFFIEDHTLINDLLQENINILSELQTPASELACHLAHLRLNGQDSSVRQQGTSQLIETHCNLQCLSLNRQEVPLIGGNNQATLALKLGVSNLGVDIKNSGRHAMKYFPSFNARSVNYFKAIKRMHSKLSGRDDLSLAKQYFDSNPSQIDSKVQGEDQNSGKESQINRNGLRDPESNYFQYECKEDQILGISANNMLHVQIQSGCQNGSVNPEVCQNILCSDFACKSRLYNAQLEKKNDQQKEERKNYRVEFNGITPLKNMDKANQQIHRLAIPSNLIQAEDFSFFGVRFIEVHDVDQSPCGQIHDQKYSTLDIGIEDENVCLDDTRIVLQKELKQPHFSKRPQFVTSIKNGSPVTSRRLIHIV